mmetsp:Transcript_24717/g.82166  ORF Transcript_24717/g.82166 Transcript_24717/m.82166 type:complete len:378 (-) Transcript_24717:300-1433(-)
MSKRRCALARRGARVRTHKVRVVEPQPPSLVEPELLEPLLLVEGDALLDDGLDLAGEHAVERKVGSEPVVGASRVLGLRCGMIRHGGLLHTHTRGGRCAARVLVVVCSDLLGARARADLHLALRGDSGLLLLHLHLVQLCAQHLQRQLLVFELRPLLRHEEADAGRLVRQVDRRLDLVDVLPARAARASRVHLDVAGLDLDGNLVHLGHDSDRRRRGVHAPLRLCRGHALHTVDARLELELRVDRLALDLERRVAHTACVGVRGGHDSRLPALRLGVARVEREQVVRPNRGLVAAGARADLKHHVLVVVWVGRQQQQLESAVERLHRLLHLADLGARHLAQLRVLLVEQLLALLQPLLEALPLGERLHRAVELGALA